MIKPNSSFTAVKHLTLLMCFFVSTQSNCQTSDRAVTTAFGKNYSCRDTTTTGGVGMGYSYISRSHCINLEFNVRNGSYPGVRIRSHGKGIYVGIEAGQGERGATDYVGVYGGREYGRWCHAMRIGATLGWTTTGNSVWDLTPYGGGYLAGADGNGALLGGIDLGYQHTVLESGIRWSAMAGLNNFGITARLIFSLTF